MARIPYDSMAPEANRFIINMVSASSWEEAYEYWDQYNDFIETCGWTDREFDLETIRRVDAAWEHIKRLVLN